jgi:hypothetical protein
MTLQRLTRISLLAALCVALRQAFAPFPNVQPISAIFFRELATEGLSDVFPVFAWIFPDHGSRDPEATLF